MPFTFALARFCARAPVYVFLVTVSLAACEDSGRTAAITVPDDLRAVTFQDSLQRGLVRSHASVLEAAGVSAAMLTDPGLQIVSLTPSSTMGYQQPTTIVGITSGPVGKVIVVGSGAIYCSGSYGTLIGYDSAGTILGQTALSEINAADCSPPGWPDNVTFGLTATLTVTGGIIAKFEITPMTPLTGPVFNPANGEFVTGHFYQDYSITLEGTVPRISVECTPVTITRASSTPVSCTASASGGTLAITGWTFTATDAAIGTVTSNQTSVSWTGTGVASGDVTVQGTVDGVAAASDTGRIAVTPRSGWSWSTDSSTGDATPGTFECVSDRHYATGNFGWTRADSTCANPVLMLWPDPSGISSDRGYTIAQVPPGGPNAGLWYATSDGTGMHVRAQVLKDIRPDGFTYSVGGKDTVGTRCKAVGVHGNRTVTVVNNTCMTDPSPLNFAALYAFAWQHEQCHLMQIRNVFSTIPDPRTRLEAIVRSDTAILHFDAVWGTGGYNDANLAITGANTIDTPNPQTYSLWSRDSSNTAWFLRSYQPNAILAPGC